jgi:hypothetical protein
MLLLTLTMMFQQSMLDPELSMHQQVLDTNGVFLRNQYKCRIVRQKSTSRFIPFLADANVQDFLFARLLVIEAPYAAKGKQTDVWNNFNEKLVNTSDIHGGKPFAL